MGDTLTLLAGHPYFRLVSPHVSQMPWDKGRWCVRYRDFHTVKQDVLFDTKAQADAFAASLTRPPLTVEGDPTDLAIADDSWRALLDYVSRHTK